jgi:hypothetical protein
VKKHLLCLYSPATGKVPTREQIKDNFVHLTAPSIDCETFPVDKESLRHDADNCATEHDGKSLEQELEKANGYISKLREIVKELCHLSKRMGWTLLSLEFDPRFPADARKTGALQLCTNSIAQDDSDGDDLPSFSWKFRRTLLRLSSTQPEAGGEEQSSSLALSLREALEEPVKDWVARSRFDRDHMAWFSTRLNQPLPDSFLAGSESDLRLAGHRSLADVFTEIQTSMVDTLPPCSSDAALSTLEELPLKPISWVGSSFTPSLPSKRPATDDEGEELPSKRRRARSVSFVSDDPRVENCSTSSGYTGDQ